MINNNNNNNNTHLVVHQRLQILGAHLCKRDKVHATIIESSKCIFYHIVFKSCETR